MNQYLSRTVTHAQARTRWHRPRNDKIHPPRLLPILTLPSLEELPQPFGKSYFDVVIPSSTIYRGYKVDMPLMVRLVWRGEVEFGRLELVHGLDIIQSNMRRIARSESDEDVLLYCCGQDGLQAIVSVY